MWHLATVEGAAIGQTVCNLRLGKVVGYDPQHRPVTEGLVAWSRQGEPRERVRCVTCLKVQNAGPGVG